MYIYVCVGIIIIIIIIIFIIIIIIIIIIHSFSLISCFVHTGKLVRSLDLSLQE